MLDDVRLLGRLLLCWPLLSCSATPAPPPVATSLPVAAPPPRAPLPTLRSLWSEDASQQQPAELAAAVPSRDGGMRVIGVFRGEGPFGLHATPIDGSRDMTTLFLADLAPDGRQRDARWLAAYRPGLPGAVPDVDAVATPDGGLVLAFTATGDVKAVGSTFGVKSTSGLILVGLARDGKLRWSHVQEETTQIGGIHLARGGDGSLAVAGRFIQGPSGSSADRSEKGQGTFVATFAPDGAPRWLRSSCARSPFSPAMGPHAVAIDDEGGTVIAGMAGEEPAWSSCSRPPISPGLYVRRYSAEGALGWTFSEPPHPQLYTARLALGGRNEVDVAWTHARPDGTGGIGGSVVARLDGATGQLRFRAAARHAASALLVQGGRIGVAGGFDSAELGVTWFDGEGHSLGASRYGGVSRWAGGSLFFTTPDELCAFGVVSDCSPLRPSEELGPAARCAATSPLFLGRIAIDAPPPPLQVPRQ